MRSSHVFRRRVFANLFALLVEFCASRIRLNIRAISKLTNRAALPAGASVYVIYNNQWLIWKAWWLNEAIKDLCYICIKSRWREKCGKSRGNTLTGGNRRCARDLYQPPELLPVPAPAPRHREAALAAAGVQRKQRKHILPPDCFASLAMEKGRSSLAAAGIISRPGLNR